MDSARVGSSVRSLAGNMLPAQLKWRERERDLEHGTPEVPSICTLMNQVSTFPAPP